MESTTTKAASTFLSDTNYIHSDSVLSGIYERAVNKFMDESGERIVFYDLVEYLKKQIYWRKQSLYEHGLPLLKEVCAKIAEDFNNACEFSCPEPTCYRDIYFAIFD